MTAPFRRILKAIQLFSDSASLGQHRCNGSGTWAFKVARRVVRNAGVPLADVATFLHGGKCTPGPTGCAGALDQFLDTFAGYCSLSRSQKKTCSVPKISTTELRHLLARELDRQGVSNRPSGEVIATTQLELDGTFTLHSKTSAKNEETMIRFVA